MGRVRQRVPSPAMVVAVIALVFAVAGSAVATVATVSVLNKKEKKQTRRIAKDEINKAAPGLSVANAANAQNAGTAQNANAVGGIPPSEIGAIGRTNNSSNSGSFCTDDDHNGTQCIGVNLDLPRSGRVLVVASAGYQVDETFDDLSGPGSGTDDTDRVEGFCRIQVDGSETQPTVNVRTFVSVSGEIQSLAVNSVTPPLGAGLHSFALRCSETDGAIRWFDASISPVMLGSA